MKSNSVFFLLANDSIMIIMMILISLGRISRGVRAFLYSMFSLFLYSLFSLFSERSGEFNMKTSRLFWTSSLETSIGNKNIASHS